MTFDITKQTGESISEAIYLAAFSCFLILGFLESTTFTIGAPEAIISIIRSVLLGVGIYRVFVCKSELTKSTLVSVAVLFGLGLFFLIARGDYFIVDMAVVMMGSIGVPFKRIGSLYIFIAGFIGVLALICSQVGVIPDYVFYTDIGAKTVTRHSFGIIYPTDCFAHLFYLGIVYFIVRWKRITYIELGIIAAISVALFMLTGARAGFACMVLSWIMVICCKLTGYREVKISDKFKAAAGALIMPFGALFMLVLTWFFKPYNELYAKIDNVMTQRLSYGRLGFDLYGFTPLGSANFAENGNANGGVFKYDYVFYDSSYIKMLFKYGFIVLILVLVIYALISVRLVKNKMFYAVIFIAAIALSCVIEHHIWELPYNLTFLLLTADMSSCLQTHSYIINNK